MKEADSVSLTKCRTSIQLADFTNDIIDINIITSPARDSGGARYCNQFVHNVHIFLHNVLNSCEFAPTINSRRQMAGLALDGLQVSVHTGCAQGQGQGQRSRDTGTFVLAGKSLLLPRK